MKNNKMKILEVTNLRKIYNNSKEALKGVSLSINKGEFIALLGPNGAGKSTFINILADVVIKTSGTANVCGYDLDNDKINFKRHIGIVPQDTNFDPFFTPFEVLLFQQGMYGLPQNKEVVMTLLENMGLKQQAHTYARTLSGGMKRRLLVAKALIHDPEVIILDEPTAGVDIELRQHLFQYLKKLNQKGKTIILTTHYLEEAEILCDKIAIINHGTLVAYEDKKTLLDKIGTKVLQVVVNKIPSVTNFLQDWQHHYEDNNIFVKYNNENDVGKIIEEVLATGISIKNIHKQESDLEEVFLTLTKN